MERTRNVLLATVLVLGLAGIVVSVTSSEFPVSLPQKIAGWTTDESKVYTRDTIFEYIDGGAELYLSYGFSSALTRKYAKTGEPDILADVFDMGSSRNAFGVFSHSREAIDSSFGQGSQYTRGLLLFWKDKYYVSILASPETEASKKAVFELARTIDDAIPGKGPLPGILDLLPRERLVEKSIRYFHHHVWLNSHYFVAEENILHIDETTDAVLAKYIGNDKRWFLLIVEYPNEEKTRLARTDFITHYLPEMEREPVVEIEDSTWTGCRGVGSALAVVFNAPAKEIAVKLLDGVEKNIESRNNDTGGTQKR